MKLKESIEKVLEAYMNKISNELTEGAISNDIANENIRMIHHVVKIKEIIDKWD